MRSKRPFRSLIVCVSCAMVGCILTSTAYSRRVNDLETERDIYASKSSNWERMAGERDETIDQLQTEVDKLTAELNAQTDLTLTYAGAFSCTAYCSEEYAHICGEGHGITSSGAKVQPGVTVAAERWKSCAAALPMPCKPRIWKLLISMAARMLWKWTKSSVSSS